MNGTKKKEKKKKSIQERKNKSNVSITKLLEKLPNCFRYLTVDLGSPLSIIVKLLNYTCATKTLCNLIVVEMFLE